MITPGIQIIALAIKNKNIPYNIFLIIYLNFVFAFFIHNILLLNPKQSKI